MHKASCGTNTHCYVVTLEDMHELKAENSTDSTLLIMQLTEIPIAPIRLTDSPVNKTFNCLPSVFFVLLAVLTAQFTVLLVDILLCFMYLLDILLFLQ